MDKIKLRKQKMSDANNQEIQKKKKRTRKIKPEDYLMTITTLIDSDLIAQQSSSWSSQIQLDLDQMNIKYEIRSQIIPNTITWERTWTKFHEQFGIHQNLEELSGNYCNDHENYLIYFMTAEDLINEIKSSTSDHLGAQSPLNDRFKTVKEMMMSTRNGKPNITIFIYGLKEYFNNNNNNRKSNRNQSASVSLELIEQHLIKLQILDNINYRLLETAADIGINVMQFSKSIAEIPYKKSELEKYSNQKFYLMNDNKNCVDVRNAIGLKNLWQHHLIKLPLVTLEIAEAIIEKYPMPKLLFDAYELAGNENGPDLLANIPIRRGIGGGSASAGGYSGITGIASSVRKIGPELSRKIYSLYTNNDSNFML